MQTTDPIEPSVQPLDAVESTADGVDAWLRAITPQPDKAPESPTVRARAAHSWFGAMNATKPGNPII